MKVILSLLRGGNFLLRLGCILTLLYFVGQNANAATYYSRTSGNWSTLATWSTSSGGLAASNYPKAGDIVYIERGFTVTVDITTAACASLNIGRDASFGGGNTRTGFLAFATTGSPALTISGTLQIGGSSSASSSGTVTFQNGATLTTSNVVLGNATSNSPGTITMNNGGTLAITNSFTSGGSGTKTFTPGSGTVNYSGTSQAVYSTTYNNLTLSGSGTKTLPATLSAINGNFTVDNATTVAQSALTIGGSVLLNNGYSTTWGAYTHKVGGSWTRSGYGTSTFTGSTINFNGTAAATISEVGYASSFENVTITKTTNPVTLGANLSMTGALSVNSGSTLAAAAYNLTVGGTTALSGTFSAAVGTNTFTGDVTINSGGVWNETAAGTYAFSGSLVNNGSSFTASTGTHTFNGSSKLFSGTTTSSIPALTLDGSYTNNGTLTVGTTFGGSGSLVNNGTLNIGGTAWNINLTANAVGNTVNYTGASDQTIKGISYYNLGFSGIGKKTFPSSVTAANTISFASGSTADLGSNFIHNANSLVLNGTTQASSTYGGTGSPAVVINTTYFTANTGIINTANSWTGVTSSDWHTASNWSKGTVPTSSDIAFIPAVTNNPVISASAVCLGVSITSGASLTLNGSNTLTVSGNIVNAGTINCNSGTLSLTGTLTNTGTFNSNTGTVNYSGAAQTVAAVSYYNLSLSGSGVKTLQTGTTSIGGNLALSGTATTTTVVGLYITGNLSIGNGATFNAAGYALTVAGTTTVGGGTSGVLNITSATGTKTFTGALTINSGASMVETAAAQLAFGSDVTIAGTLTEFGAATVGVAGNFTNNGTYTSGTGAHTFSGVSKTFSGSSAISISNLNLTGSYTNSGTLTVGTGGFAGAGTLTNTGTLNTALTTNGITLVATAVGNTVNYNGTAAVSVSASTFYNLSISGTHSVTLTSATTTANNFSIASGCSANLGTGLTHSANVLYLNGTAQSPSTFGGTGSSALTINTTYFAAATGILSTINMWTGTVNTDWHTSGNWSRGTVPTSSESAYVPNVTNKPIVSTSAVCNNLTVASGSSLTLSGVNTITLSGNLTNSGTISCNSGTLSIAGTFTNTGTFNSNTGTVNYNGAAQTVTALTYYNLLLSGSGVKTLLTGMTTLNGSLTLSGTASTTTVVGLTIAGNLGIGDGTTFNAAGFALTVTGATAVGSGTSGTLNFTSATGTKTFTGNVTLNSGSVWNETAAAVVSFGGHITNNAATFTASTGTHTLSGSSRIISGNTAMSIPTVSCTGSYTNSGTLTIGTALSGTGGSMTNAGTLNIGGTCSVTTLNNSGTLNVSGAGAISTALASFVNTGTLNLGGTGTIAGITNSTGGAVNLSSSGTITSFNNATSTSVLNISALTVPTISTLTTTATGNTVDYNGSGAQTVKANNYYYLILQGSGAKTFPTGTTTITRLLSVEGTSTTTLTGSINYGTDAILQYKGSSSQTTGGEFPTTFAGTGGVIIDNTNGVSLGGARTISNGPLTLLNGKLTTTTTNLLSLTNVSTTAISGGSSTAYINGPLRRTLRPSLTGADSTYVFPVGTSTSYLPFSIVAPTTGAGTVTAQLQAVVASTGGSYDATLSGLGTTEYWLMTTVGTLTNSKASVSRSTAISPLNALAASATLTGTYTNLGGSVGTYSISNSGSIGSRRYFVLAKGANGIFYTPTSISGLTYQENLGPSSSSSVTVGGYSLTDNIRVEALANSGGVSCFEVSTDNSNFSSVVTLPVVSQVVSPTPVYVRMKSGLSAATYSSSVQLSSNGQTTQSISCTGTVSTAAALSTSVSSVSGLTYVYSSSSSTSTNFTVSGTNLVDTVKVTPPTGYQVSTDGINFYSVVNLNTSKAATLTAAPVYIRLIVGLGVGSYSGNIIVSSTGAISKTIACSGTVTAAATLTTNTSFLGGFLYAYGTTLANSPAQKVKIYGTNLGGDITVTSVNSTYFLVSKTLNGSYGASVSYTASGSFVDSVYVKMNVGTSLTATNEYGPYAISFSSSGAVTKSIGCKGKVVASSVASVYSSAASLTGFGYQFANGTPSGVMHGGPSSTQSVVVSGVSLSTNPLVVSLTSANFEISLSPYSGYQSSLSLTPTGGVVAPTTIYVRLKSGLAVGTYPGNLQLASSGATTVSVSLLTAQVYLSPLITATGTGSYCVGDTIELTSSGDDISSRYWEGPNSYYSIVDNNTLTTNATAGLSGNYVVTGNVVAGGNLIYNGSFEDGFVGFGSNYNYRDSTYRTGTTSNGTYTYGALYYEGDYSVVAIPHNVHVNFTYNGPKAGKKQMVVNGSPTAGVVIWSQSVAVIPGADYQFTYYEQTAELPNPSRLQLYINGVAAGPVYTASSTKGLWTEYLYNASAGSNSILNLELVNQNIVANGNDFALDDIQFKQVLVAKDTAVVAVSSNYPVSVTLTASANPVNTGVPVTFTATPTNGGDSPVYTWYKNNSLITGAVSSTYTYEPTNGDVIKCVMHSSLTCVTGNPANASVTMVVTTPNTVNYWVGTLSTDWGNALNWSANTIPASGEDVIYASTTNSYNSNAVRDLYLDQNRTIGNLINKTERRLVIPAGKCLTVNSSITVVPQNGAVAQDLIYIYSSSSTTANGSLIYHNSQDNPVYATVEMYSKATWNLSNVINDKYNWQYFGIPVDGLIANPTFQGAFVRRWDEKGTTIQNHWVQLSNDSIIRPFYGYELCQEAVKTYQFKGKLVNRNFASGQLAVTSAALYPGQHIFSNPYTAAIDIKQLLFGSQTEQVIYQYNTGSFQSWTDVGGATGRGGYPGQYITSTPGTAGSNGVPGQVPSMGSMLVKAMSVSSSATFGFNYSTAVVANTDRQRVKAVDDADGVVSTKIEVSSEYGSDCAWLFTHERCSSAFDNGWDAFKMDGIALQPQLYALGTDGSYQINATSDMNNTELGFRAGSDTEYKLRFTHENTQRLYPNIYLVDEVLKTVIDITNSGSEYSFTAQSTPAAVNRFRIVTRYYENNEPDFSKNIKIFGSKGAIFVHNMSRLTGDVAVYDISGHMISRKTASPESILMINSALTPGAYVIKCVTSAEDVAKRVIVQ